ncbi:outer membrane beta-barrel protein [Tahibacter amnicola]|uniref:Outer membrane beta-barrel protein n=1 Tax=Tahibacter amnicola TaxID=2976241 RepID=A0ABY6BH83_9GAMM|nr:outer membrane beta-barrel protein [Tahibacter amnicola]UXI68683.1 outer membrane beta-barrel protein [Tahibacter amnicola]
MNTPRLLLILATTLAAGAAQANDPGFYVGGGLGQASYDDTLAGQVYGAYRNHPTLAYQAANLVDDEDQTWKAFAGYRFLPWLGVELAWNDLGEVTSFYSVRASNVTGGTATYDGTYEIKGVSLALFGDWEFTDRFSGIVRAGLFNAETDYRESGLDPLGRPRSFRAPDDSSTEAFYGLGLNWRVTPSWDLRLDWDRYLDIGNQFELTETGNGRFEQIDVLSLNVAYRFGQ